MNAQDTIDSIILNLLQNNFIDGILSSELRYCMMHRMSIKERQVIEHLVEGYKDEQIYSLMRKVFPSMNAYRRTKARAKKKLMHFLGY